MYALCASAPSLTVAVSCTDEPRSPLEGAVSETTGCAGCRTKDHEVTVRPPAMRSAPLPSSTWPPEFTKPVSVGAAVTSYSRVSSSLLAATNGPSARSDDTVPRSARVAPEGCSERSKHCTPPVAATHNPLRWSVSPEALLTVSTSSSRNTPAFSTVHTCT